MFAARHIVRSTRTAPATRRVGLAQTLPSLSRAALRSFWDQDQPGQPRSYNTAPDQQGKPNGNGKHQKNNGNQQQKANGPGGGASARQEPPQGNGKQEQAGAGGAAQGTVNDRPFPGFPPIFFGFLAVGIGLVSYGLYGLYAMTTLFPTEVRHDLRKGLRLKRKGEWDAAIQYLSRAWDTARNVPRETFGPQALLKISGIGIALAGALEERGQLQAAYTVYQDVLWFLRTAYVGPDIAQKVKDADPGTETVQVLAPAERMRAIAVAYKLGELAGSLGRTEEEEKWLVWSVEALLRTVLHAIPVSKVEGAGLSEPQKAHEGHTDKVIVEVLGLPVWSAGHNIAAPFEALASFYSRQGKAEYALPLYLQAISIFLPPAPAVSTVEDRCRGAQLMGNVADLILRTQAKEAHTPEAIFQAESWAKKGLEIVDAARSATSQKCDACEEAYAVLLYNLGMIRELTGDQDHARELLEKSLEHSTRIGMHKAIKHANGALQSLDRTKNQFKPDMKPVDEEIALAAALE